MTFNLQMLDQRGFDQRLAQFVFHGNFPDFGEYDHLYRITLGDEVGVPDRKEKMATLKTYLKLNEQERLVLGLRNGVYGQGTFTLTKVAALLGTAEGRVYVIESNAERHLRYGYALEMREVARLEELRKALPQMIADAKADVVKMEARLAELEAEKLGAEK